MAANFMVFADVVEARGLRPRGSATRAGISTTTCTRTRTSSRRPTRASPTSSACCPCATAVHGVPALREERREHRPPRAYPRLRDLSILVGDEEDVLDRSSAPTCRTCGSGRASTSSSPATYHFDPRRTATAVRPPGLARRRAVAWSRSAAPGSARTCSQVRRRPSRSRAERCPACAWSSWPVRGSTPRPCPRPRLEVRASCPISPAPRGRRPGHRAGRADHHDGAGGRQPPVPVLPAAPPLRAAAPRGPPARPARRRACAWTTTRPRSRSARRSPTPGQARGSARCRPTAPPRGRPHRGPALTPGPKFAACISAPSRAVFLVSPVRPHRAPDRPRRCP